MIHTSPILIAGAGPTGLTLALDLARRGVPIRIIDAAPKPPTGSRGKGLQPRTLEVFDMLGVVEPILTEARPYPLIRRRDAEAPDMVMHEHRPASADIPYPNTLMLPQDRTEAILRERLAALGVTVEYGKALTDARQDADGVTAWLGDEAVRCAFLVGCDGGKGVTRRLIGAAFEGETREDERVLFADVLASGVDREAWSMWMGAAGPVGLCPLPGTDRFQFSAPLTPDESPSLDLAGLRAVFEARAPQSGVTLTAASWVSLYRYNARLADRYRQGRILLAGDAAHVHSAAGGQGLNTSVQDAWNLGWKLALVLDGAHDRLLDTYEAERRPLAADVLGLSGRLHAERTLERDDTVKQLGIGYRGSALSRQRGETRLKAGDRVPGQALARMRHGKFTDLTIDGERLLARPDGYVALAGAVTEDAAGAYLADLTAGRF